MFATRSAGCTRILTWRRVAESSAATERVKSTSFRQKRQPEDVVERETRREGAICETRAKLDDEARAGSGETRVDGLEREGRDDQCRRKSLRANASTRCPKGRATENGELSSVVVPQPTAGVVDSFPGAGQEVATPQTVVQRR
jgi:hypothetical protein